LLKNDKHIIYNCVITKEGEIFCSLCIELNVATEGTTQKEAKLNLIVAVKDYIELALENNIPLIRELPAEDNPLNNDDEIIEKFKIETNVNVEEYA